MAQLDGERLSVNQFVVSTFRTTVMPRLKNAWEALTRACYSEAETNCDQLATLTLEARKAAETFANTTVDLYLELNDKYENACLPDEVIGSLFDAAAESEQKMHDLLDVAGFMTRLHETLNNIRNITRPTIKEFKLREDIQTKPFLEMLSEFEEKDILSEIRTLITDWESDPDYRDDIDQLFVDFFKPDLKDMLVAAVSVRTVLLRAAVTRTIEEDAKKVSEIFRYSRQLLENLVDEIGHYNEALALPDVRQHEKEISKAEIGKLKAVQVATLIDMVRTLTETLMDVRIVKPTQRPENDATSWQQHIRERTEQLLEDVSCCYDGIAGLKAYLPTAKVPSDIRLEVMELIAKKASSITADLDHIKTDLESPKRKANTYGRTLAIVKPLSETITELESSLTGQIDDAKAERRRGAVLGSKPFERKAADERMKRAQVFAAENLKSFSVKPYEEPEPAPAAKSIPLPADSDVKADKEEQSELSAVTGAGGAGPPLDDLDDADEFAAISRRLDTLEETVLPTHRADLMSAMTSARIVINEMEEELRNPGDEPLSPQDIWHSVKLVADRCEAASAKLQEWANQLKRDAKSFTKKTRGNELHDRFSTIKQATDDLLATLKEKESELWQEAHSMRLARSATMFEDPTLSGYEILSRNNCFHHVEKRTYTPQNGRDYGVEFAIYLETPNKLRELGCEPEKPYRAVLHYHFPWHGNKNKPTYCRFKRFDQRFLTDRNSEDEVYSHEVPLDVAMRLFKELDAIAITP